MPRGSKKSANPHNTRHENGVVAPGKRIVKQKSNTLLNGAGPDAGGAGSGAAPTTPPVPKQVVSPGAAPSVLRPNGVAASATSPGASGSVSGAIRKDSRSEAAAEEGARTPDADDILDGRRGETNAARAYFGGLPRTVVLSSPLRDTLAMLVLLLSIPPFVAALSNAIFAAITFVPPSGSFFVLPTLSDITSSNSPTTPSLLVIAILDILAVSVWIWIPFSALQAFFIDAAQAMVATNLGGGNGYRSAAKDNTFFAVSVVVVAHIARYRSFLLRPIQHRLGKFAPLIGEFDATYIDKYPVGPDRNWKETLEAFLALHIFCQGMTGMVRRRLNAPRQNTGTSTTSVKAPEPETAFSTGADLTRQTNPSHSPTELRAKQSLQNLREANRDKISSGKRRRKQFTFVRTHQPLWTAVAMWKTWRKRRTEATRANADAMSSHASNSDNLGSAPFLATPNRVWVTEVKFTGFFFETSVMNTPRSYQADGEETDDSGKEGVDRTKPLYVRCNKTDWVSIRMIPIPESGTEQRQRWVGEVYGLSAGKTYQIAFVKSDDDEIVLTQTIAMPAISADPASATIPSATFSPVRPSSPASPTATLKSSIASHEDRLSQLEEQQRRIRKDNKAALLTLHRDIDGLNERMQSHSSNDDTLQNRHTYLTQHKRQLDDAVETINTELDASDAIPKEELDEWHARRSSLDGARKRQTKAHDDLSAQRKANKVALDTKREHELNARHKAERLQARLRSAAQRYTKLTESKDAPRSNSDPASRIADRDAVCARYEEDIAALTNDFQLKTIRHNALVAQVNALAHSMAQAEQHAQAALMLQQQQHMALNGPSHAYAQQRSSSRPGTPEHDILPGGIGIGTGFGGQATGSGMGNGPWYSSAEPARMGSFAHGSGRQRSMSAVSQDSGGGGGSGGLASGGLAGGPMFHPDDDDLVPVKVKRRSGAGFVGSSVSIPFSSPSPAPPHVVSALSPLSPATDARRNGPLQPVGMFMAPPSPPHAVRAPLPLGPAQIVVQPDADADAEPEHEQDQEQDTSGSSATHSGQASPGKGNK